MTYERSGLEDVNRAIDLGLADERGLKPFANYQRKLRADFSRSLQSAGKVALTALSTGVLFFLTDPDAPLAVTVCNRAMTAEEWDAYTRSPAAIRKRKPQTLRERAAAEADGGRRTDETMQELQRSGEMRVVL